MPWRGRVFVGLENYREAIGDERFWEALGHTAGFALVSVGVEMVLGLGLALLLQRSFIGRGVARVVALLPWAMPAVVVALVWRFLFEPGGAADAIVLASGVMQQAPAWLSDARLAWVPIVLADVWKTTPFVALLLLSGLQAIDPALYEAARVDGARARDLFWHVTLPGLRPALVVAVTFRGVDAFRVFDLIYVLTGGGPGTATEPLAMYSFVALLRNLRFGYGSALAVIVFAIALVLGWGYLRAMSRALLGERR